MVYSFTFIEYKQAGQDEELSYGILAHNDGRLFDRSFLPVPSKAAKRLTSPTRLLQYLLREEPWKWHGVFSINEDGQDHSVDAKANIIVYINGVKHCYSPS